MEKEFLSYNQSLAAKELGFDEPCLAIYFTTPTEYSIKFKIPVGELVFSEEGGVNENFNENENCASAPLKQQFLRWVREKYNINFFIQKHKSDHVWYLYEIHFERLANGENPPVMVGHTINSYLGLNLEFNTYEEAESALIDKLIEIIKNKTNE